mgnify:FL=1
MKRHLLTFGLASLLSFPLRAEDVSYGQVVLHGLDKITGRLSTMTVNVGEKTTFGALDVYPRVCFAHPPEETPENAAFLDVVERKEEGQLKLFSGWMFSSSPALSAMEHPVYDVWVVKCAGEPAPPPVPEPLVLENPIEPKPVAPKLKIMWDEDRQTVTDLPDAVEEKPVDPEDSPKTDESAAPAENGGEPSETGVIRIERKTPEPIDGGETSDEDRAPDEPGEFRLIPIAEPADSAPDDAPAAVSPSPDDEIDPEFSVPDGADVSED